MKSKFQPWQFLLLILAGWINRRQQDAVKYLVTENPVLREKLGKWNIWLAGKRIWLTTINGGAWLSKALAQVRKNHDLVIIDCAPTESVLTDAAYFASRYIIVPIKPEFMATIGLPLLARSLQEFQIENDDHEIEIAGLVFVHSSSHSAGPEGQQSIKDVNKVAAEQGWHICENQVRYSASYAKAAREQRPLAQTSYTRSDVVQGFHLLADEIFGLIGMVTA